MNHQTPEPTSPLHRKARCRKRALVGFSGEKKFCFMMYIYRMYQHFVILSRTPKVAITTKISPGFIFST
ncbi:hypothetical protein AQUCO_01300154v1 [Aquilegia coerulea]|uniref:Uncharacterized protein n=1 Tax=Aquilegia coerulea TaxID=218851 RepID=A0A2G5E053_AQUCA|nr:hypothetical protein AQUCO_01300154v1 [Aquilegia coerulea]